MEKNKGAFGITICTNNMFFKKDIVKFKIFDMAISMTISRLEGYLFEKVRI